MSLLKQIMATLNSDMFRPKCLRQRLLIKPALNFWKMIYNAFTAAGGPMLTLYVILPLLYKSKKFQLPFQFWYPYNTKISPFYEITYLHQVIGLFYSLIAIYNIDMLIAALMIVIGAQCDILSDELRNFKKSSIISSIIHHQEILIFASNCNKFINFILLGQFFASSVILSLVLYRLALDKRLDIKLLTHLLVVVFYTIQIFTYCWFGNEVEVKSNQIPFSVYESDWTNYSLKEKKDVMILILRSQKPIKLSAFNLFYLSLETYIKILRSSWTYLAVLRSINNLE
ncbi:7tm 6 domain containing protein [Asbolus verrucosus]|uniref:7tm 6 domain containing protein n=1 Tax=Asbolus verrucosus TaxID=1661398 RepID=A0A482VL87_ASBVE|nr:7tm 6 domain containing protein [Asbolus verrucosus]